MMRGATKLNLFDDRAEIELAEHSAVIKTLGKRVVADVIEIGARLTECKRIAGHGNWLPWLEREFGWTEMTATRFINVHTLAGKSNNLLDLDLPLSGLYLLAAPSTPEPARDAVLDLATNGEQLTHTEIKEMIAQAKQETADDYEQRINRLTARYEEQQAQLRKDLAESLSPADLDETITRALAPLQDKIKRLEDERKKSHETKPKRKDVYGRQAAGIVNGLHYLVGELTIDAEKFIEHHKIVADATGRSLQSALNECLTNARTAHAWLTTLLEHGDKL